MGSPSTPRSNPTPSTNSKAQNGLQTSSTGRNRHLFSGTASVSADLKMSGTSFRPAAKSGITIRWNGSDRASCALWFASKFGPQNYNCGPLSPGEAKTITAPAGDYTLMYSTNLVSMSPLPPSNGLGFPVRIVPKDITDFTPPVGRLMLRVTGRYGAAWNLYTSLGKWVSSGHLDSEGEIEHVQRAKPAAARTNMPPCILSETCGLDLPAGTYLLKVLGGTPFETTQYVSIHAGQATTVIVR